jgi:GAF domain-containing protein
VEAIETAILAQPAGNDRRIYAGEERILDLADLGARVVGDGALARQPEPRAPRGPASPAAAAALEAEIDRCGSREAVARLAVYLARSYASATALLLVHRGLVQGLCADGIACCPDTILFPTGAASAFADVASTQEPFRGAPPASGLDARILRAFGREHVQEIAILPVILRGRVVGLLYADNGPEALGDASAAALVSVCARVATAYERLIHERKRAPR